MDKTLVITGPFVLGEVLKRRNKRIERNYRKWLRGKKIPHPNPVGPKSLSKIRGAFFDPKKT